MKSSFKIRTITEVDSSRWDAELRESGGWHFSLSSLHAEYCSVFYGRKALFVTGKCCDTVLKALIFVEPHSDVVTWDFAPLVEGVECEEIERDFLNMLTKSGYRLRRCSSYPGRKLTIIEGLQVTRSGTFFIRLDDQLWDRAYYRSAKKKRKVSNICRKCDEKGISIVNSWEVDSSTGLECLLKDYERLIIECQIRFGNNVDIFRVENTVRHFKCSDLNKKSISFFAIFGLRVVAAVNLGFFGEEAYIRKLVYGEEIRGMKVGASYYVLMKALEWAMHKGFKVAHFPLTRPNGNAKSRRIHQFKKRFGGVFYSVDEVSTI